MSKVLPEPLVDEVGVKGSSEVFHFIEEKEFLGMEKTSTVCGNLSIGNSYYEGSSEDLEKVLEDGKRPCKQCIRWAKKKFDIEVLSCLICNRINIIYDIEISEMDIEYKRGGAKTENLCRDCIDKIKSIEWEWKE